MSQRLAEEAKKRERFEELKQHLEQEQEVVMCERKAGERSEFVAIESNRSKVCFCVCVTVSDEHVRKDDIEAKAKQGSA